MRQYVTVYVDDFIIGHHGSDVCHQIVNELINILNRPRVSLNYQKSVSTPATTMEVLGFTISKGKIILPIKRREKLINNLRSALEAQSMSKRGRQRILSLVKAWQLAIGHIDLTKERALLNEVVQSIPEGNAYDLRAVFQEEYEAFASALHKIDDRERNDKPPVEVVENDREFDLLDRTTDISVWTDASISGYISRDDFHIDRGDDHLEEAPAID